MTDKELMQQALDALEYAEKHHGGDDCYADTIEAIRARLSQCDRCGEVNPAEIHTCSPQEPVAWGVPNTRPTEKARFMMLLHSLDGCQYPEQLVPLYTTPPQREWQGLTDEDVWELAQKTPDFSETVAAVEAKLKAKNDR